MTIGADQAGRGWRVAVSGLGLVTIAAYGVAYYSYGVLIDPIRAQTGWSSPALGAIFSGVLVIGGAGGLAGGRLVDRVGTRPAFLLAGTVGAGAVAAASYQHGLLGFGVLYAVGCGVIAALGFYHVTQVPVMIAAGLPIGAAASIGGLRGFAQLGGRIPLSPVLRRLGARQTIVLSLVVGAVGVLLLLASGLVVPAIVYSILAGTSIGAMYTLQGIYTNQLVGHANLSLLMGAQSAVFAVGGAAGPVLAGPLFAATNSYVPAVPLTAAGLLISAAIMSTSTLRPPGRSSGSLVSAAEPASEPARGVGAPPG